MNHFEISQDPKWYRLVDGFVLLTIGVALGLFIALMFPAKVETTRVIRRVKLQSQDAPAVNGTVEASDKPKFNINEI